MTAMLNSWLAPWNDKVPALAISDVRTDSRAVVAGDVFVAVAGVSQDGVAFIADAVCRGAVAVLTDSAAEVSCDTVPVIKIDNLHSKLPELLQRFYTLQSRLRKVGVTGTNGKTTISQLVGQIGQALGQQVAVIGTLGAGKFGQLKPMNNTTPGLADNFRLLDGFYRQGCELAAMEVSSQGLDQGRVEGIAFDTVVFSNLSQDHLDYHGDMARYESAKQQLFDSNPGATAVINIDDAVGRRWVERWQEERKLIVVGAFDVSMKRLPYVMFDEVEYAGNGLYFSVKSSWGEMRLCCPLYGRFNLYNLVSALAVYLNAGYSLEPLAPVVQRLHAVAGRMERFADDHVVAVVDYAHTPDALSQALQALKDHVEGRLWCIFGCGGDRDKGKRPLMGQIAQRYADRVVLTNDNPRHEDPMTIIEQIGLGMTRRENVIVEPDRKKAIAATLAAATDGDIVLIAGKGHETYQIFGDETIEYDERSFVREYFAHNNEEKAS